MVTLDLITLLLMIASFVVFLVALKLPSGLSLMISAVIGLISGCIIHADEGLTFSVRYLIEGGYGYIDSLLVIIAAMILIKFLQKNGGLDYLSTLLIKVFNKFPTILLILFMALLLLPGMVTGSSTAAVISIGIIIAPIMLNIGIPRKKTAAFIGLGAILGMVAPPINIPVMVICDVVDIPYSGFGPTLMLLTIPTALFITIFFSRDIKGCLKKKADYALRERNNKENWIISAILFAFVIYYGVEYFLARSAGTGIESALYTWILVSAMSFITMAIAWIFKPFCHQVDMDKIKDSVNLEIFKELKWTCLLPLICIVVLFVLQSIFPKVVGVLATPLLFIISASIALFTGRKFKLFNALDEAAEKCIGIFTLLMGVGMFIEVLSVTGARALIVANVLTLLTVSKTALYIAMAISLSIFGGISSFASASVFGGPFVMALYGKLGFMIVASACSLIAALGEFLPPTGISARLAAENLNHIKKEDEKEIGFLSLTKEAAVPLLVTLVWAMLLVIVVSPFTA